MVVDIESTTPFKHKRIGWRRRINSLTKRKSSGWVSILAIILFSALVSLGIVIYYDANFPNISVNNASLKKFYEQYYSSNSNTTPQLDSQPEAEYEKANATLLSLVRNEELWKMAESIRHVEDRFNNNFHYDWVFFNEQDFSEEFINVTSNLVSGNAKYAKIPTSQWSFPDGLDIAKYNKCKNDYVRDNVIYGGLDSYRHMCRFNSGFFYKHPVLDDYKWYWRVEPNIKLFCDVTYDPFKFMIENNKSYGFIMALEEFPATVKTLWQTTKDFLKEYPNAIADDSLSRFVSRNGLKTYNMCHFWSNFEIASLDFFRSETYEAYFKYLDDTKGFFYERWGDAPIHSIAASLFLNKSQIHMFDDFGYYHNPFGSCPRNKEVFIKNKCNCDYSKDFTFTLHSCAPLYYDIQKMEKPDGWQETVNHPAASME